MYSFIDKYIWGEEFWIENDVAWYVGMEVNALFCLHFDTSEYEMVKQLPDLRMEALGGFRCMKIKDRIYCFPARGREILIYSLKEEKFSRIEVTNNTNKGLGIINVFEQADKLYIVSQNLKQVLVMDIETESITEYHTIADDVEIMLGLETVGNNIYCWEWMGNRIYEYNLKSASVHQYILKDVKEGIGTICFNGAHFILTGYSGKVYCWNKDENRVSSLGDFPRGFGIYPFTYNKYKQCFITSRLISGKVWFIPYAANCIIYMDDSFTLRALEIDSEREDSDSLNRQSWPYKYEVCYVVKDRYLGLYSFKNKRILEIDTVTGKSSEKDFYLNQQGKQELYNIYQKENGKILFEENKTDCIKACFLRSSYYKAQADVYSPIGKQIYNTVGQLG